jgi:hypothetical protein
MEQSVVDDDDFSVLGVELRGVIRMLKNGRLISKRTNGGEENPMIFQTFEWPAVLQRIDRLERDHRRWKSLACIPMIILGLILILGISDYKMGVFHEIRAQQFILVDADGKMRASLRVGSDESAALALVDKDGWTRAGLAVLPDGSPRLRLYDQKEKPRSGLGVRQDGLGVLALADTEGTLFLHSLENEMVDVSLPRGPRLRKLVTSYARRSAGKEDCEAVNAEMLPRQ